MSAAYLLRPDRRAALMFVLALLIASYLLFTLRTVLDPVDPGEVLSAKRLATTAVGATMFWLLATRWRSLARYAIQGRLWRAAMLVLAAMGPVLATRVGYDLLLTGEGTTALGDNIRWILAWSGYFIAAVLGYQLTMLRDKSAPAWSEADYLAHLLPEDEGTPIAFEIRR